MLVCELRASKGEVWCRCGLAEAGAKEMNYGIRIRRALHFGWFTQVRLQTLQNSPNKHSSSPGLLSVRRKVCATEKHGRRGSPAMPFLDKAKSGMALRLPRLTSNA